VTVGNNCHKRFLTKVLVNGSVALKIRSYENVTVRSLVKSYTYKQISECYISSLSLSVGKITENVENYIHVNTTDEKKEMLFDYFLIAHCIF